MAQKILVVDDDSHIREVIRFALEQAGMEVFEAANGEEGLASIRRQPPDLVILDILMPEMDGLEMCRQMRKITDIPILFLSSRNEEMDRVIGLEIGGDDYVTKPFSPRELVARVQAIFRRLHKPPVHEKQQKTLRCGAVSLDMESHCAYWRDTLVELTATEFAILQTFLEHPNRVFSRDALINEIYDPAMVISDRTIDSHVRNLRHKYLDVSGTQIITTVHGIGYKLAGDISP